MFRAKIRKIKGDPKAASLFVLKIDF